MRVQTTATRGFRSIAPISIGKRSSVYSRILCWPLTGLLCPHGLNGICKMWQINALCEILDGDERKIQNI